MERGSYAQVRVQPVRSAPGVADDVNGVADGACVPPARSETPRVRMLVLVSGTGAATGGHLCVAHAAAARRQSYV